MKNLKHIQITLTVLVVLSIITPLSKAAYVGTQDPFESLNNNQNSSLLTPSFVNDMSSYDDLDSLNRYIEDLDTETSESDLIHKAIKEINEQNIKQALIYLNLAWQANPSNDIVGLKISFLHIQNQEYEPALVAAQKVQKIIPHDPLPFKVAGIAYMGLNDVKNVKSSFSKALELQPGAPDASLPLAQIAIAEKKYAKAREIFQESLVHYPKNERILMHLAKLESSQGNYQQSISNIQEAINYHPDSQLPRVILIKMLILTNNLDQAIKFSEESIKKFPNESSYLELLGIAYLQSGNTNKAIVNLKSAVKSNPRSVSAHYYLALAYEQLPDNENAIQNLQAALKSEPNDIPVKFALARINATLGNLDVAKKEIDGILKINPQEFQSLSLAGQIALSQHDFNQASEYFHKAYDVEKIGATAVQLAYSLMKINQLDAAFTILEQYTNENPEDLQVKKSLADFYKAQGKNQQAQMLLSDIKKRQKR